MNQKEAELEDRALESNQCEEKKGERMKNEQSLRDPYSNIRYNN